LPAPLACMRVKFIGAAANSLWLTRSRRVTHLQKCFASYQLGAAARVGGAETASRAGARLCRLGFAIARRGVGHGAVEPFVRRWRHPLHRAAERRLVCLGGACKSAQLTDELQRRRTDFLVRGGRFEVMERPDVSTHGWPHAAHGVSTVAYDRGGNQVSARGWRAAMSKKIVGTEAALVRNQIYSIGRSGGWAEWAEIHAT